MNTTAATTRPAATDTVADTQPTLWRVGLVAGVVASIATTAIVLVARAADVAVDVDGKEIPILGFAQLTMVGALIGIALAKVFSKRANHPRRTFVATTVTLTALSLIPDVISDTDTASKLVLMLTHVVAAALIVPVLARRLAR